MEFFKNVCCYREILDENLNRMLTTHDERILKEIYEELKESIENIYLLNKERIHFNKGIERE